MKSINVFISYAWESKEIEKFAQWLGFFLDKYGISIKLDKFEVYPGSNLQKYMRDGLNKSKYVLCIVTDAYKAKMVDPDTGVYTETQHIEQMASKPFIIPLLQKDKPIDLPGLFDGKFATILDMYNPTSAVNKDAIYELITLLLNKEGILPTSAGSPIEKYAVSAKQHQLYVSIFDNMQFDIELEGSVRFYYAYNEHKFVIGRGNMSFITEWTKCGYKTIYSYNHVNSFSRIPELQSLKSITSIHDIMSLKQQGVKWSVKLKIGDGLFWINNYDIAAVGVIKDIYTSDDEFKCYVDFDYKILNPIEHDSPFEE